MRKDYTKTIREEREEERRQEAIYRATTNGSVMLSGVLFVWIVWAMLIGLTNYGTKDNGFI
jgi:hypothetical protein